MSCTVYGICPSPVLSRSPTPQPQILKLWLCPHLLTGPPRLRSIMDAITPTYFLVAESDTYAA